MRKWMRDRLQRRKKKPADAVDQPAPPPLQPAYFDAEQSADSSSDVENTESQTPSAMTREPDAGHDVPSESDNEASPGQPGAQLPAPSGLGQAGRSRRRRGGRGRGGRGREQAVAQAFTPAAVKGSIPVLPVDSEDGESAGAEPQPEGEPQHQDLMRPAALVPPHAAPSTGPRPPKGIVVLAIGLPGSGKSSWFKRHNIVPLSSDMVRSLLFDDVREQRFQDLVFSNLRSMLKARLIAKRPMNYVDATNLTPQERQHWIKLAKDYQYEVQAVFFDVPLEICVERHQRRDRVVPEDVMRRMAAKLKPPAFEEGFAKITVVRVKKKD